MIKGIANYPIGRYSCNVIINGQWFTILEISQYYRAKKGRSTVSDEKIQELVKQLYGIEKERDENGYYSQWTFIHWLSCL